MNYTTKHTEYMKNAGLVLTDLPADLQGLIKNFNSALGEWNKAGEAEQQKYLSALVQSDALIAARIFTLNKEAVKVEPQKVEPEKIDTEKLKALKAKMLLLNKKNNKK